MKGWRRTFLPSGMAERSTSTLAMARTSADADMLTRKSVCKVRHRISMILFHISHHGDLG